MKIATRLKFSALVPLLMAVVIGLALFLSNGIMKKAEEEADSARRIVTSMNNVNTFGRHYMAYHEDRAQTAVPGGARCNDKSHLCHEVQRRQEAAHSKHHPQPYRVDEGGIP